MRRAMPPPAVAAEELPIGQTGGFGDHLHAPGDLRFGKPEHLHSPPTPAGRPASRARMAVGVMATTAPCASTSVLERMTVMRPLPSSQRWASPQVNAAASPRRNPPSERTAARARSNLLRSTAAGTSQCRGRGDGAGRL